MRIVLHWEKNRNKLGFYHGLLSGFACIHASEEAKNKMNQAAKTHIWNLMENLAETSPEVLDYPIEEIATSRWMSGSYDNFIVQFELLHHLNKPLLLQLFGAGRQWYGKNPFFDVADA